MMTTSGTRNCIAQWISGTQNLSNLYHVFLLNGEESYSHNVLLAKLFHCFEGQDLICYRSLKTFCAIFLVTVPPIPSQGDLPWLVAKNDQIAWNLKSFTCLHKLIRFFKFLYWPAQPLLQYSICLIWGNVSWIKLHTNLWSSWTKLVSWSRSSPQDEGWTGLCSSGIPALHPSQWSDNFLKNQVRWCMFLHLFTLSMLLNIEPGSWP